MTTSSNDQINIAGGANSAGSSPKLISLADLLAHLPKFDIPEAAHRDIRWAVNTLCKALGLAPVDVAAEARVIRQRLDSISPAMIGLSPNSFNNMRSILRRLLRMAGKSARRRARNEPLNSEWATLYGRLGKVGRAGMGSFISYCSTEGTAPGDVETGHLGRFATVLEEGSFQASWRKTVNTTVREWNKATGRVEGWPATMLTTPWEKREIVTLPMTELPSAFQQSVSAHLNYLLNPPADDDAAPLEPLRAESIKNKEFSLRYMASVLLRAGTVPADLTGIEFLLSTTALDTIMGYFAPDEAGAGRTTFVLLLGHLLTIAKHQSPKPIEAIQRLQTIYKRHKRKKRHGLTKRNRGMIARLSDDRTVALLVQLPPMLFGKLAKVKKPTVRAANLALAALYIELSLMWPARVGNLSKIHMDKNIVRSGTGRGRRVYLRFDATEVKNEMDLHAELPPSAVHMLDVFLERYRPLLVRHPSDYLFPHRDGGPRHRGVIWQSVTTVTDRYVGVPVNPHLFRHFGVDQYLKARPGDYENPRRVLGHSSIDTTTRHYAGAETGAAIRLWDENVLRLRSEATEVLKRASGRRRTPVYPGSRPSGVDGSLRQAARRRGSKS